MRQFMRKKEEIMKPLMFIKSATLEQDNFSYKDYDVGLSIQSVIFLT